jgi:short-subunit dehydrogenase
VSYRRALVTGASSGIGRALAIELARSGAEVVLAARRAAKLDEVAAEIAGAGGRARTLAIDLDQADAAAARIAALDEEIGGLDLVIANAGVGPRLDAAPFSWEAVRGPCHVNFCGAAATLTAALPAMVARRAGHLVGIGSLAAFGALPGSAAYCAPKAGLSMLLECLRLDVASAGVAVTAVHLGFVATPMVAHRRSPMPQLLSPAAAARHIARALPGRPAEIAFPQPLALFTAALGLLPRPLRGLLFRPLDKL